MLIDENIIVFLPIYGWRLGVPLPSAFLFGTVWLYWPPGRSPLGACPLAVCYVIIFYGLMTTTPRRYLYTDR